jgi:hypothetical protein
VPRGRAEFTAVIRVAGPGRLPDFRERVHWLMVRDIDAEAYVEHHAGDALEYRFELERGIPFPAFATASSEFPELRVEAEWRDAAQGVRGRAVIENGRLIEQESVPLHDELLGIVLETGAEGEIRLGLACARRGDGWLGYALSESRHAYFRLDEPSRELRIAEDAGTRWTARLRDGDRGALDEPIDDALLGELEAIAFRFAADWLWYDEDRAPETTLERKRYAAHGWRVAGANLKSEQRLRVGAGRRIGRLTGGAERLPALLRAELGARA